METKYRVWDCKVGCEEPLALEDGSDLPMRHAVREAFKNVTGIEPEFLFSGWGGELTESEAAVVENRVPAYGTLTLKVDAEILTKAIAEISQPLADILAERNRQDEQWGGPDIDDGRSGWDWANYIERQVNLWRHNTGPTNDFRGRMVKVAALALSAIQSYDRVMAADKEEGSHA